MEIEEQTYEGTRYRYGCNRQRPEEIGMPLGYIPGSAREHDQFKYGTGDWHWRIGEAGNLIKPPKQYGLHLLCIEMGYEEQFAFQSELGELFNLWADEVNGDSYFLRTFKEGCIWKLQRLDPTTWRLTPLPSLFGRLP